MVTSRLRVSSPPQSTRVWPSTVDANWIVSVSGEMLAWATASRRLSLPSLALTRSCVVVTVNVAIVSPPPFPPPKEPCRSRVGLEQGFHNQTVWTRSGGQKPRAARLGASQDLWPRQYAAHG